MEELLEKMEGQLPESGLQFAGMAATVCASMTLIVSLAYEAHEKQGDIARHLLKDDWLGQELSSLMAVAEEEGARAFWRKLTLAVRDRCESYFVEKHGTGADDGTA